MQCLICRLALVCVPVLFYLPGSAALADDAIDLHPFLTSKYSVQAGVFSPRKTLILSLSGTLSGPNNDIDFGRSFDLGMREDVFAFEFTWRFGTQWSLRAQRFKTANERRAVLSKDISWGDTVIQAGSSVTAGTSFKLTRLFFARSFSSNQRSDYGIGLGLHWLSTGAFLESDIIVNSSATSTVSATGPLPNIGTWYYYSPSAKWYVGGRLDWFSASVGDYSGTIVNASAGVNYQLFKHIGVGLKYQFFELAVDIEKFGWRGGADVEYEGTYIYLSGDW